jgi:hypothetical protein
VWKRNSLSLHSKLYSRFHSSLKTFNTTQFQSPTLKASRVSVTSAIRKTAMLISFGMDPNNLGLAPSFAKTTGLYLQMRSNCTEVQKWGTKIHFIDVWVRSFIRQCIYIYLQNCCRRDYGSPPWCKWDLRSSRVKQSTSWTDSLFKMGPISLSRNNGN